MWSNPLERKLLAHWIWWNALFPNMGCSRKRAQLRAGGAQGLLPGSHSSASPVPLQASFVFISPPHDAKSVLRSVFSRQEISTITPAVRDAAGAIRCSQKEKRCICKVSGSTCAAAASSKLCSVLLLFLCVCLLTDTDKLNTPLWVE